MLFTDLENCSLNIDIQTNALFACIERQTTVLFNQEGSTIAPEERYISII